MQVAYPAFLALSQLASLRFATALLQSRSACSLETWVVWPFCDCVAANADAVPVMEATTKAAAARSVVCDFISTLSAESPRGRFLRLFAASHNAKSAWQRINKLS
jgi:hypothetical protein